MKEHKSVLTETELPLKRALINGTTRAMGNSQMMPSAGDSERIEIGAVKRNRNLRCDHERVSESRHSIQICLFLLFSDPVFLFALDFANAPWSITCFLFFPDKMIVRCGLNRRTAMSGQSLLPGSWLGELFRL